MAEKMVFPTKGGGTYELHSWEVQSLQEEFATKDVQAVLDEMQAKLYSGKYQYTVRGIKRAIRSWLTRAPEDEQRKRARTTKWEESYWYKREQAQAAGASESPPGRFLPEAEVQAMLQALRAEIPAGERVELIPPLPHWRTCLHEWEPSWFGGDWCPKCRITMAQINDMVNLLARIDRGDGPEVYR